MNKPFSRCVLYKAMRGDEVAYKEVVELSKINLGQESYVMLGCKCNPPCEIPTVDQEKAFYRRFQKDLIETLSKREKHKRS